jgi:hypothetical protein
MARTVFWAVIVCLLLGSNACKKELAPPAALDLPDSGMVDCSGTSDTVDVSEEKAPDVECSGEGRVSSCFGNWAAHCNKGKLVELHNCREDNLVCVTHPCDSADDCEGCKKCSPGSVSCGEDGELTVCKPDGSGFMHKDTCDEAAGLHCSLVSAECEDLCAVAERDKSYIGCDYWAVATRNSKLALVEQDADALCQPFTFAVVVANPQGVDAHVKVHSEGLADIVVTVAPEEAKTIKLPCSLELKGDSGPGAASSVQAPRAAHHITSDVPVTVYQFNPLEFQARVAGKKVYSYTNDASLLLPSHSLSGDYVVMSLPTLQQKIELNDSGDDDDAAADAGVPDVQSSPGFVAIIGADSETVEVEVTSSAYTGPSADGKIPALEPGQKHTFMLAPGDVLQLVSAAPDSDDCPGDESDHFRGGTLHYCKVGKDYDLTGTRVHATGKVAVISGHDCAFVPYNRFACDHVEETMFPLEAWGKSSFISISEQPKCQPTIPNMIRVYSDTDDNLVSFVPAETHEAVTLGRGEFIEFEARNDFYVIGKQAIMVAQFLVGQEYRGIGSTSSFTKGDPSLSLGVPYEQWRTRYSFLAPASYVDNFVNVIAQNEQVVLLDGRVVSGFTPIEGTKMATARVPIAGGEHRVESPMPVGIVVYGYAPYTSYMMPGGLDLTPINGLD